MNELEKTHDTIRTAPGVTKLPKIHPLLKEANDIVNGPRREDYGHPTANHNRTATLWNAYLKGRNNGLLGSLDAEDVCILNILQKISRHAHSRKRDNLVDIVGWATNAHIVGNYHEPQS